MPDAVVATSANTVRTFGIRWRPDSLFCLSTDLGTDLGTDLSCGDGGWGSAECVRQPVYLAKMLVNCQLLWATPEQVSSFG
ncbi:hypothetical protein GCM10010317_042180 [Streptomyces mirabilis]|nr:hypothetical protein GCM10010317_042180 [Streptomyces mirabilis]